MSVQLENGYTRIANELLDVIVAYKTTAIEKDLILAIIRLTYGFNSKEAVISLSTLAEMTQYDRSNISRALTQLIGKNVIEVTSVERLGKKVKLNKNYLEWKTTGRQPITQPVKRLPDPPALSVRKEREAPLVEEVIEFFIAQGHSQDMAERFFYYYDSQGWMTGGENSRPISNWRSKAKECLINPTKYNWLKGLENGKNTRPGNGTANGKGSFNKDKYEQALSFTRTAQG